MTLFLELLAALLIFFGGGLVLWAAGLMFVRIAMFLHQQTLETRTEAKKQWAQKDEPPAHP